MIFWIVYGVVAFAITVTVVALDARKGYADIDEVLGAIFMGMFWPFELVLLVIYGVVALVASPFMLISKMFSKK